MKSGTNGLWPDVQKTEGALFAVQQAFWAAVFVAAMTAVATYLGVVQELAYVEAALFIIFAAGLAWRSSVAAVLVTLLYVVEIYLSVSAQIAAGQFTSNSIIMPIFILLAFTNGIRGTFALRMKPELWKKAQKDKKLIKKIRKGRIGNIVGIVLICWFVASVYLILPADERQEFREAVNPPAVVTDATNAMRLTLPDTWIEASGSSMAPGVLLQVSNADGDVTVAAAKELRAELERDFVDELTLDTYNSLVLQLFESDLQEYKVVSQSRTRVAGVDGIVGRVQGIDQGFKVLIDVVTFEVNGVFYRVVVYGLESTVTSNQQVIQQVLDSVVLL